jgi:hypothetical protein
MKIVYVSIVIILLCLLEYAMFYMIKHIHFTFPKVPMDLEAIIFYPCAAIMFILSARGIIIEILKA